MQDTPSTRPPARPFVSDDLPEDVRDAYQRDEARDIEWLRQHPSRTVHIRASTPAEVRVNGGPFPPHKGTIDLTVTAREGVNCFSRNLVRGPKWLVRAGEVDCRRFLSVITADMRL